MGSNNIFDTIDVFASSNFNKLLEKLEDVPISIKYGPIEIVNGHADIPPILWKSLIKIDWVSSHKNNLDVELVFTAKYEGNYEYTFIWREYLIYNGSPLDLEHIAYHVKSSPMKEEFIKILDRIENYFKEVKETLTDSLDELTKIKIDY